MEFAVDKDFCFRPFFVALQIFPSDKKRKLRNSCLWAGFMLWDLWSWKVLKQWAALPVYIVLLLYTHRTSFPHNSAAFTKSQRRNILLLTQWQLSYSYVINPHGEICPAHSTNSNYSKTAGNSSAAPRSLFPPPLHLHQNTAVVFAARRLKWLPLCCTTCIFHGQVETDSDSVMSSDDFIIVDELINNNGFILNQLCLCARWTERPPQCRFLVSYQKL